jgi:hypothetical protein
MDIKINDSENMKFIYHHLGLGDHIICNGMVRHYKEIYGKVAVFCKPHNYENVKYMYRDDENIEILSIGDDSDVNNYISSNKIENDVIRIGFENLYTYPSSGFDESFYKIANIPFEYRFSKFFFLRDTEKEKEVFNYVNANNEEYIFVHGDVDRNKIRTDLKIIENPTEFKVFDILKIIENATEVHIMESSIKCFINSYVFERPSFYYHQYIRGYDEFLNSKGKNKFTTIY